MDKLPVPSIDHQLGPPRCPSPGLAQRNTCFTMPRDPNSCVQILSIPGYLHVNCGCWGIQNFPTIFWACNWQPWQPMLWMISTIWDDAKFFYEVLGSCGRTIVKRWYVPFRFPQKPNMDHKKNADPGYPTTNPSGMDRMGWVGRHGAVAVAKGNRKEAASPATKKQTDVTLISFSTNSGILCGILTWEIPFKKIPFDK